MLSLSKVGAPFDGKIREGVVYRLKKAQQSPVKYQCLTVSDSVKEPAEIIMISDFRGIKERLRKKVKKGTGLEVTIAAARKMNAVDAGRWFDGIRELYLFCQASRYQFILSSGATSMHEMVSGPCFDAILKNCNIDPDRHWREMNRWLDARLSRRVSV